MSALPALSRAAVDRAALRRTDDAWLRVAWKDPESRVLVLADGATEVVDTATGPRLALVGPSRAPDGERYLLGVDADRAYWAVPGPLPGTDGARAAGLREVGALLDDRDAGLFVHAVALAAWHERHPRCPRCGGATTVAAAGASRHCPADGSDHFPRVDPAVIMLVHDGAESLVLSRQAVWPPGRFSILAGFVEPGESAEGAVAREVAEEVGLAVTDVRYVGSQPWPFPQSLMLGFLARVEGDRTLRVDRDELEEARWFTREELRSGTGPRVLPPPVSIARHIIDRWVRGEFS